MFYSESILNRSVKSFLLPLSLLINGLQAGQSPALPGSAAAIPAIQELQQFEKAQPLPLPRFPGQVAISVTVGTLAGAAAFNWLTATPVLSFAQRAITAAGMTDFLMPKDIAYVGGGLVWLGISAGLLYKFRTLQEIVCQNERNQNAAVQVAGVLAQSVLALQEGYHAMAQRQERQETAMGALQTGQDNLGMQVDNLARQVGAGFTAAEQARAADTQALQQQAATNHQASQERFEGLQGQLDALPAATVQAFLAALEGQRLAQQQEQRQKALPVCKDAAAATEVQAKRAIEFRPGVFLRPQQQQAPAGLATVLGTAHADNHNDEDDLC